MTHRDRELEFQRLVLEVWAQKHPNPDRREQAARDLERLNAGETVRAPWREEPVKSNGAGPAQSQSSAGLLENSDGGMGDRE